MPSLATWAPFLRNLPPGTLRNLSNPASRTYTNTRRNFSEPSRSFRGLPEPTPFYTGTLRNLPEPASGPSIRPNSPEPSGTRLRNLHQHTPELSGTFRNLPPEPAPATCTGTHRSLSGLKTPLAYAVGEKYKRNQLTSTNKSDASLSPSASRAWFKMGHWTPLNVA